MPVIQSNRHLTPWFQAYFPTGEVHSLLWRHLYQPSPAVAAAVADVRPMRLLVNEYLHTISIDSILWPTPSCSKSSALLGDGGPSHCSGGGEGGHAGSFCGGPPDPDGDGVGQDIQEKGDGTGLQPQGLCAGQVLDIISHVPLLVALVSLMSLSPACHDLISLSLQLMPN